MWEEAAAGWIAKRHNGGAVDKVYVFKGMSCDRWDFVGNLSEIFFKLRKELV